MVRKTPVPVSMCLCCTNPWKGCSCPSCLPLPLSLSLLPVPAFPAFPIAAHRQQPACSSSPAGEDSSSLHQSFRVFILLPPYIYFSGLKPNAQCSFGVGQSSLSSKIPAPAHTEIATE